MTNKHSMDLFLEACGAIGPLQLSVERFGRPEGGRRVFPRPFALIGRDPGTDLPLDEPLISRRHAYVQMLAGRLFCIDLGSRTGIHWDGEARKAGWLDLGRVVRIGTYSLRFAEGGRPPRPGAENRNPLTFHSLDGRPLPDVMLEFTNVNPRRVWDMNCTLALVGRGAECRVRLKGSTIAEYHCALVRTPRGVWVVDLLGREGTRVNQERVPWAYLANGDQLQVGSFNVRVWHNAPPPPSRPEPVAAAANHRPAPVDSLGFPGEERILFDADDGPGHTPSEPLTSADAEPEANGEATALALAPALDQEEIREALLQPLVQQFAEMQQQMSEQLQQAMTMVLEMFSGMHQGQVGIIRQEIDRLQQLTNELNSLQAEVARSQPGPSPAALNHHAAAPTLAGSADNSGIAAATPPGDAPATQDAAGAAGQGDGEVHLWLFQRIEEIQNERRGRLEKIFGFLRGK